MAKDLYERKKQKSQEIWIYSDFGALKINFV